MNYDKHFVRNGAIVSTPPVVNPTDAGDTLHSSSLITPEPPAGRTVAQPC